MKTGLKVYILPVSAGRRVFYAKTLETEGRLSDKRGLQGWTESLYGSLHAKWNRSEARVATAGRWLWGWLNRRIHPDESLLSQLRSAQLVEVHYPASMSENEVRATWEDFLVRGRRRHRPWFVVNLVISPLTVVLAPLPGPNLIGYWFAFRACRDFMVLLGLRRAIKGGLTTTYRPTPTLEPPMSASLLDDLGPDVPLLNHLPGQQAPAEARDAEASATV